MCQNISLIQCKNLNMYTRQHVRRLLPLKCKKLSDKVLEYMAVDLKVLVRSFNCESRACYVGNPRNFFEFAKDKHFYSRGLEAHPCTCRWYCLTLLSEVSRNKLQMQQPSFQKWGESQTPRPVVFAEPCWWLGSADRGIFAKVPRKSWRKSKCILKRVAQ